MSYNKIIHHSCNKYKDHVIKYQITKCKACRDRVHIKILREEFYDMSKTSIE